MISPKTARAEGLIRLEFVPRNEPEPKPNRTPSQASGERVHSEGSLLERSKRSNSETVSYCFAINVFVAQQHRTGVLKDAFIVFPS